MNEAIRQMLKRYDTSTVQKEELALHEILQELALLGLWRGKFFEVGAFCGGTALRVLFQLDRFSEDLDFSLIQPNPEFNLSPYFSFIEKEMKAYGFNVEIVRKEKSVETPIESAFIKADTAIHLIYIESKNKAQSGKKIKLKFEVDTSPCGPMKFDARPVLLPTQFFVKTLSLPYLFAEKMHAVLFRRWKKRIKGRDWYDFAWYVSRNTPLCLEHLKNKMIQSETLDSHIAWTEADFHRQLKARIDAVDFDLAKNDVQPFLHNPSNVDAWGQELFHYLAGQITLT